MYDLSVIVSGIRTENWKNLIPQIINACSDLKVEIIFAGPYYCKDLDDTHYAFVRDFGSPARSFAKAAILARGKYICQCPDDSILFQNSFKEAFSLLQDNPKKVCIMRYNEGENFSGKEFPLEYWNAQYHSAHFGNCLAIKPEWNAGPWFMMNYNYYLELGGVDCRFEHLNLNVYDIIYRVYRDGGEVVFSPNVVASLDWKPNQTPQNSPCCAAFIFNDMPLLTYLYQNNEQMNLNPIKIHPLNWKLSPEKWARRFGN